MDCLASGFVISAGARDPKGRAVLFVPLREEHLHFKSDAIALAIYDVCKRICEETLIHKVVFIVDLRNGAKAEHLKQFIKLLDEKFRDLVGVVLVVRGDKFWDRHKTVIEKNKYSFPVQPVSSDQLLKFVDKGQLTGEFGGTLYYNHEEWLAVRKRVDLLFQCVSNILQQFEQQSITIRNFPIHEISDSSIDIVAHKMDNLETSIKNTISAVGNCDADVSNLSSSLSRCTNPDLISTVNRLRKAVDDLKLRRMEVTKIFSMKQQEAAVESNATSMEKEAEKLLNFVLNTADNVASRMYDIGFDAERTNILLREHQNIVQSINNVKVTYGHLEQQSLKNWNARHHMQSPARMDRSFRGLQEEWKNLNHMLSERSRLLQAAVNFHEKYNQSWLQNAGIDPTTITHSSVDELKIALDNHKEFKENFEGCYAEALNSATEVKNLLIRDSRETTKSEKFLKECIQYMTNIERQLTGIYESRLQIINNKLHARVFFNEVDTVVNWLDQHGEPYLKRKITIGRSLEETQRLQATHEEFKKIASNTYNSTKTLLETAERLIRAEEIDEHRARQAIEKLRNRMKQFTTMVDSRTKLLYVASNFFMHYKEIMDYYRKLEDNERFMYLIDPDPQESEDNKSKLQEGIAKIKQAYHRIMSESKQLKTCLKDQREIIEVHNREAEDLVNEMTNRISSCHNAEEKRWPMQRMVLNHAAEISSFIKESYGIRGQIIAWYEDLRSLPQLTEDLIAKIAVAHEKNMYNVKMAVNEALAKQRELQESVHDNNLTMLQAEGRPVLEVLESIGADLYKWNEEVMKVAQRLQKSFKSAAVLDKIQAEKAAIINSIIRSEEKLASLYCTPDDQIQAELCKKEHEGFRMQLQILEENKITFTINVQRAEYPLWEADEINEVKRALDTVQTRLAQLKQNLDNRIKMFDAAKAYYTCVQAITCMDSIERHYRDYLDKNQRVVECQSEVNEKDPKVRLENCKSRIVNHKERKEKFMNIIQNLNALDREIGETSLGLTDERGLGEFAERLRDFRARLKTVQSLNRKMRRHAELFLNDYRESAHFEEVNMGLPIIAERYEKTEKDVARRENELRRLSGGETYQAAFDRNSDGSLEEKLTQHSIESGTSFASDVNDKLRKPMMELLGSERDYISDLEKCITIYLKEYRMMQNTAPPTIRNKEAEIFGNIEKVFKFHSREFLERLMSYEYNPEDVGCSFIFCMDQLKELYTEYCLNKAENGNVVDSAEALKLFNDIRERHKLPHSLDILSMLIKPVQRITRYRLLLDQVMRYSNNHTEEMRDALDVVVNIPRVANDRMHLKNFEDAEIHQVGEFILQDSFIVSEPKRVFKRDKEMQVFLFESSIVFTKKDELPNKKIRYLYKYKFLLGDIHIVEHVSGDDASKFGLRKGSLPQSEIVVMKSVSEENRRLWVKTLRELIFEAQANNNLSDGGRALSNSVGRLRVAEADPNHNKASQEDEAGAELRKSSQTSTSVLNDRVPTDNPSDVRNTIYSTTSSDGDLPPAMDLIIPTEEVLD